MTKEQLTLLSQILSGFATHLANLAGAAPAPEITTAETPVASKRGRKPASPPEEAPAEQTKATTAPVEPATAEITDDEMKQAFMPLVQEEGRGAEVKALITSFGTENFREIPQAQRAEFLKKIQEMKF